MKKENGVEQTYVASEPDLEKVKGIKCGLTKVGRLKQKQANSKPYMCLAVISIAGMSTAYDWKKALRIVDLPLGSCTDPLHTVFKTPRKHVSSDAFKHVSVP